MTIETQAHDVLHRAGDEIDVPPPPLDALLGSTARRRRRMAAAVAGLSAAAVVVAVAVLSSGGDNGAVPPPTNPAPPTTAEGTRLVGMNGVMVSVPQDWVTDDVKCGTALSDTVYFDTGAVRTCRIEPRPDVSVLHVAEVGQNDGAFQIAQEANTPVTVGGLNAFRSSRHYAPPCPQPDPCDDRYEATLYFPSLGIVFWGSSPHQGVVDPILDSAQPIPDGYVAIPLNTTGSELEAMGLDVDLADGTGPDEVAPTSPREGSVVALGSTVTVGSPDKATANPIEKVLVSKPLLECGSTGGLAMSVAVESPLSEPVQVQALSNGRAVGTSVVDLQARDSERVFLDLNVLKLDGRIVDVVVRTRVPPAGAGLYDVDLDTIGRNFDVCF
jgi:hypothetical protein